MTGLTDGVNMFDAKCYMLSDTYLVRVDLDMVFSLIVGAASLAASSATVGKASCWCATGLGSAAALGKGAYVAGHGAYWGLPGAGAWSGAAVSAGHGAFWGAPGASAWSAASVGNGAFMPPYLPY